MENMSKSKVEISYDLSSEEGEDTLSDTTADDGDDEDGSAKGENSSGNESDWEELSRDVIASGSDAERESGTSDREEISDDVIDECDGDAVGEEDATKQKSGLADVMAKILRKQVPTNKPVILSKALTDKELRLKRKIKEEQNKDFLPKKRRDEPSSDEDDVDGYSEQSLKKKAWEELGRRRVDITQRESEKMLQRTATKGVLQLFNAVSKQQKLLEDKIREVGGSERRKDHVIKSMTKGAFLDMLKATPNVCTQPIGASSNKKLVKKKRMKAGAAGSDSDEAEGKPSWGILREDFMMGAKMKDWDKESDDNDDDVDEQGGAGTDSDDQS